MSMKDRYRRSRYYCPGCDRTFLGHGKKCPICGFKDSYKKRRLSKQDIEKQIEEIDNKDE